MGRLVEQVLGSSLFLMVLVCSLAACSSEICSYAGIDENRPTRDISCPNGKVCYGGVCISSCNAGTERFVRCQNDNDCTNAARPLCQDGFCTACEKSTQCVPGLNICVPIKAMSSDGAQTINNELPFANEPLDAGPIDGAVFSSDTGVKQQDGVKPTHVLSIDIAQFTDYVGGQPQADSQISISAHDVTMAQYIKSATVAEPSIDNSFRCDLKTIGGYIGTSTPADIGPLELGNVGMIPGFVGMDTRFLASFLGNQYQLDRPVPKQLLVFSVVEPPKLSYLALEATGKEALGISNFPAPNNSLIHVPYALVPGIGDNTNTNLANGYQVDRQSPSKLIFVWNFESNFVGVRIGVRIIGTNHELLCVGTDQDERIEIIGRLLTRLAEVEAVSAGDQLPLHFERVYAKQIDVPIEMGHKTRLDFSIQVRHTHRSVLKFQ